MYEFFWWNGCWWTSVYDSGKDWLLDWLIEDCRKHGDMFYIEWF